MQRQVQASVYTNMLISSCMASCVGVIAALFYTVQAPHQQHHLLPSSMHAGLCMYAHDPGVTEPSSTAVMLTCTCHARRS